MSVRERVLRRDDYLCVCCREKGFVTVAREVDHVVPLHLGGADTDENKQSLCKTCHIAKTEREKLERR